MEESFNTRAREALPPWLVAGMLACLAYGIAVRGANLWVAGTGTLLFGAAWLCVRRTRPSPKSRAGINNLVLALAGIVVAALLLEVGARVAIAPIPNVHAGYLEPHPEAIFALKPGASSVVDRRAIDFTDRECFAVNVSKQGLRGKSIGPKADDEFRILMVGDSFTFGYGVEEEDTLGAQLERILTARSSGPRVTVINAGVPGYGPWQERILLREKGFALDPDLVLLQVFPTNDIADSLTREDQFLRAYAPKAAERAHAFKAQGLWPVRLQRMLRRHSRAYQAAVQATGEENLLAEFLARFRGIPTMPPLDLPPREPRSYVVEPCLEDWYPGLEEAWRMCGEDLKGIRDDCSAKGIPLFAFCVPALHTLHDGTWWSFTQHSPGTAYARGKELGLVESFLGREGVPLCRLFPVLRAYGNPLEIYFPYNRHFRPGGMHLAASALADAIIEAGQVPCEANGSTALAEEAAALLRAQRTQLLPNGDFADWPQDAALPAGWGHDTARDPAQRLSLLQRTQESSLVSGLGVRQTWRKNDSADGLPRLFGCTVEGLAAETEYHLRVRAANESGEPVSVAAFEVDERENPVQRLKLDIVTIPPCELSDHTGTFFTAAGGSVRIVAYCSSEDYPVSVLWDCWELSGIPKAVR